MATLNFKGKAFVQNHHLLVKYHQLVPCKEKSLTDKVTLHDNLIIHGDNLKYLDQRHLDELRIDFAQLPFEIYQLAK